MKIRIYYAYLLLKIPFFPVTIDIEFGRTFKKEVKLVSNDEIALQITLKAIELRLIQTRKSASPEHIELWNAFNAKQISDFYQAVIDGLKAP